MFTIRYQDYFLLLGCMFFFIACNNKKQKEQMYTDSEVASLQLDSTEFMQPDACHVVEIDLNPYLEHKEFDLSDSDKQILKNLKADDNPVLIMFQMKE